MTSDVRIVGLTCPPDIAPGANLGAIIAAAARAREVPVAAGDILVVTQKIVSKAEGRLVDLRTVTPSALAREIATAHQKDPRLIEVVLGETRRVVKMDQQTLIVETRQGFVCANAGVDESNVAGDTVVALLPADADASARRIQRELEEATGIAAAVVVSDTFGRPWREGFVNVAIGVAGLEAIKDYRGMPDTAGRVMKGTMLAVADELASAAELVMGKVDQVPVALIRGYAYTAATGTVRQLLRPAERDLFR